MARDTLFLLKHDFADGPGTRFYCHECAQVNGVLHYYPQLRHLIEVRYVDYPRPRTEIVALIGEPNQSCPVLVLGDRAPCDLPDVNVQTHGVWRFVSGAEDIGNYLAVVYGVGRPH